ncbi:hypothetical protein EYC80_007480 [Monilinia laxa]|uniref:Histone H2A C-terminal domain-containing protein n=1 Tax=Monilinia laxa TaxID=61186 RepID=A0A5N6JW17_MONLA|nr:hypothetical protein EYC80_007480 [Monilinia laxa]
MLNVLVLVPLSTLPPFSSTSLLKSLSWLVTLLATTRRPLLGHVTIAQGGVLPNIHQNLLPKKTAKAAGGKPASQEL